MAWNFRSGVVDFYVNHMTRSNDKKQFLKIRICIGKVNILPKVEPYVGDGY